MSICASCGHDTSLLEVFGCIANQGSEIEGKQYEAIPFGKEKRSRNMTRCPECNVAKGYPHHTDCPVEECPRCGGQLVECISSESDDEWWDADDADDADDYAGIDPTGICYREGCSNSTPDMQQHGMAWVVAVYITDPILEKGAPYLKPTLVRFCSHGCNLKWIKQEAKAAERENRKFGMHPRIAADFAPRATFRRHEVPDITKIPEKLPEPEA